MVSESELLKEGWREVDHSKYGECGKLYEKDGKLLLYDPIKEKIVFRMSKHQKE